MSDFLDLQGAKDLNTDAIHIGAVANSVDPVTGAKIDTHVNRVGGTDYTLQGFWNALVRFAVPVMRFRCVNCLLDSLRGNCGYAR